MRALLLAAGVGSRLRPITDTTPKCLVQIRDRPLLDYWLNNLSPGPADRVLINTHYLAEAVTRHLDTSPWRDAIDIVYEPDLLGTGGTIAANRGWLGEQAFLVAHADNLTDVNVEHLFKAHAARPEGCAITMLAFRTDDPRSCGILELDERAVVQAFHEKVDNPPGDLANAAVYVMEPEVADMAVSFGKPFVDLSTEIIPRFLGRIFAVEHRGYHRDIGNVESLNRAQVEFQPTSYETLRS
jgi:mannose-1-phosphate guanylyltransferase